MNRVEAGLRHNANFKKLWAGQSVSLVGTQVTYVALPLLAIYTINAGAMEVGLIGLAMYMPYLLVTLWAGAWIDQRRRIPVMLTVDVLRAVLLVVLATLALIGLLTMPMLLAIVFVFSIGSVFFDVSYYSILPSIVHRSDLVQANGRLQMSLSVALVGGSNVGGTVTQLITAPFALLVDAFTFIVSATMLWWMRVEEVVRRPAAGEETRMTQIRAGLRFVARTPMLRLLVISSALFNLFTNWIVTLFPVLAVRNLHLSAGVIGLVLSFGSIGSLVGAVLASRVIKRFGPGTAYIASMSVTWASNFALTLAPANSPITVPLLVVACSFSGLLIVSNVVAVSLRQSITPDHLLGRMNATYKFVSYGALSVGAFIGGLIGDLIGLRGAMVVAGIGLLSTVLVALIRPLRGLRELPAPLDEPAAPAPTAVSVLADA